MGLIKVMLQHMPSFLIKQLFLKTYYPKEFIAASMTMDISNQNKLSEFYEELKRLKIEIMRPDINKCYEDFKMKMEILLCIGWN